MRDEVVIAILSAIEPPLPECLAAVEAQEGGPYRVIHVKDCFPMSHAFNEMIRQSAPSRYVVQIDGDIILQPWAVRVLRDAIDRSRWRYAAAGQLWEEGFGRGGFVRIWRRWPVQLFGFRDRRCVDRDLHARLRFIGMRRLMVMFANQSVFGRHCPRRTPFARFSKARGDACKWRHLGRFDLLAAAVAVGDSWEIFGYRIGVTDPEDAVRRSKNASLDFAIYQDLEWQEFAR